MSTRKDHQIDRLLRAGDITVAEAHDPHLEQLLLLTVAEAENTSRTKRKRWLLAPAAVTAALVAGLAATGALPAVAETVQHLVSQTGIFGDGEGHDGAPSGKHYTEMDDSEWIDLTAPDFPKYAANLIPGYITLPADVSRENFARDIATGLAGDSGTGRGAVIQVTGVRRFFEANAACVWYQTWHDADLRGDHTTATRAAAQYNAAASWPEIVATDGGGVVASMHRVHTLGLRSDWTGARAELGTDCTRADVASVTK